MNGYLAEPEDPVLLPDGRVIDLSEGFVDSMDKLQATHQTILLLEVKQLAAAATFDHVESDKWFSETNLKNNAQEHRVWKAVTREVAVDRHQGTIANYLYADGHVDGVAADQIAQWCDEGFNFAVPPQ
jgi:prepilin-type processing-associated H-X9-DG protein